MKFVPKIDLSKKKVIIADVDDTICESCQIISDEMADQIDNLSNRGYTFAFISGTSLNSLQKMISSKLKSEHYLLATTGTNCTKMNNSKAEIKYNYSLQPEQKNKIFSALNKLIEHYQIKTMTNKDDQVQDRDSQITFSAIGRHAPTEIKAKYDSDGKKRLEWIEFLKECFNDDEFDIKLGGTTSIDITQIGMDKEWGIRNFAVHQVISLNQILFFGDKLFPGGNDYPASKIIDCIAVENPNETLSKLKELFP
jgi:HAD superfamily hydrolase (TIGR01484 family)